MSFISAFFSWKTAERLFLDAMEKIKAIGNEVTAPFFNHESENMTMCLCRILTLSVLFFLLSI